MASVTAGELRETLVAAGFKAFVAKQMLGWYWDRGVRTFDEMTNVPAGVRRLLAERYAPRTLEVIERHDSPGGSFKLLLRLADGNVIECAYLAEGDRGAVCVSSQVGCAMGCVFCASGERGLVRDLRWWEMVEQVLAARDGLGAGQRVATVTFMGIGEPLANFDELTLALEAINDEGRLNIGARRISVSTCGLPDGIRRLAGLGRQYHLAVSLHAPNDALRRELMPTAARVPIAEILAAAEEYVQRTTRKVTFEYTLIARRNDTPECAAELARRVGRFPSMVNLIPLNPVAMRPDLRAPSDEAVERFRRALESAGVEVCVRKRKGAEVDAACGQLRARRKR